MKHRADLVFPMAEFERRLRELRQRMTIHEIDALLVTTPENITYLTGFETAGHFWFQGLIVPVADEPVMVSRALEQAGVDHYTWIEANIGYRDSDDPMQRVADTIGSMGLASKRVGFEKDCWFFTASQQDRLFALLPNTVFVDATGTVEQGRVCKSELELDLMRRAARCAEAGMRAGVDAVEAGATENDVAAEMHWAMIKAGSEWPAIQPFVASGSRGAIGHATWMHREIETGDSVFLEIAGCIRRYHSALLRTCVVGPPDDATLAAFDVVLGAFDAATSAIAPGVPAGEIDRIAREHIAASEFGGTQASRTAYSMGIAVPPDWGEGHILSMKPGETRLLEENMTFHLLPWVQISGKGGIGCTETVLVTASGCESITEFPRELFVC